MIVIITENILCKYKKLLIGHKQKGVLKMILNDFSLHKEVP